MNKLVAGALGVFAGLLVSIAIGSASPAGPLGVLEAFAYAFTPRSLEMLILFSAPIVLSGVGLALAYRAGFYTIGAEGQVLLGSIAGLYAALYSGLSWKPAVLVASIVLGAVAGAAYSAIPVLLRFLRANEVLTSLMLNYVAMYIVNYLVSGPWSIGMFTKTGEIPKHLRLDWLEVVVIVAAIVAAYHVVESRTRLGLLVEAYGASRRAAETYGVRPWRLLLSIGLLAGASAGIGGVLLLYGFQYALYSMEQPPGYGYMGVLAAWLGGRSAAGSAAAGLLFAYLMVVATYLQYYGVPFNTVLAVQASIVLSVTGVLAFAGERKGKG